MRRHWSFTRYIEHRYNYCPSLMPHYCLKCSHTQDQDKTDMFCFCVQVECHYCEVLELLLDKSYYFEKHAQGVSSHSACPKLIIAPVKHDWDLFSCLPTLPSTGKTRLKGIQSALSSLLQAVGPLKIISKQSLQTSPLVHSLFKRLVEVVKQLLIAAKKRYNYVQLQ